MPEAAKEEQGVGSRGHLSARQNCPDGSKHRETPVLSHPGQLKDPKENPRSTGALGGTHCP